MTIAHSNHAKYGSKDSYPKIDLPADIFAVLQTVNLLCIFQQTFGFVSDSIYKASLAASEMIYLKILHHFSDYNLKKVNLFRSKTVIVS